MQKKLFAMMMDIDKICKDNDIEYYLIYGSAIGAVRHEGFIPWDDDLDIAMTDENYFKFLKVCEEELDKNKYFLQTDKTEKNYFLSFAKIRDITTTLINENNVDVDMTYGIYIDIFPLVGVPKNKIKRFFLKVNRAFMLSSNVNIINNPILKFVFKVLLKIFGKKRMLEYSTKNCFKYKCSECDTWISICDGDGFELNEVEKKVMGKPKYVKFETSKLPIPNDHDTYLKKIYGDYMRIPSEEDIKKKEHTPYFLDLDLPYAEYKKRKEEND